MNHHNYNQKRTPPTVSVNIVTWNGEQYIQHVMESLDAQTFRDFEILVIDNGSSDNTVPLFKEKYAARAKVVAHKVNAGFAKSYNLSIHWSKGEYLLLLNQDVVLGRDFLEKTVAFLDKYHEVGAVNGEILQWDATKNRKIDRIDNLGVDISRRHQFVNRGAGAKRAPGQSDAIPIFAFSGSCVLLRREALESVRYGKEFFDESFFAYKEDVDLSWRLRHQGWDIVFVPEAVAYHKRSAKSPRSQNNVAVARHRRAKHSFINYLSYRNHIYTVVKNQFLRNLILYAPFIIWYEFKKCAYMLVFERRNFKAWGDIMRQFPQLLKKRRFILSQSKMRPSAMRKWII